MPTCGSVLLHAASVVPAAGLAAGKVGGAQAACVDLLDSMLPLDLDDDCLRLMFGEEEADGDQGAADSESPKSGGSDVSSPQGELSCSPLHSCCRHLRGILPPGADDAAAGLACITVAWQQR